MVEQKYKKTLMIIVTLLTVLTFVAGAALGWSLDKFKVNKVLEIIQQNEVDFESFLAEEQFFEAFGGNNCKFLRARTIELSKRMGELGRILTLSNELSTFNEKEVDIFKRRYFILETLFFVKNYELSKECNIDNTIILFFYKIDHQQSKNQGYILDAINTDYYNNSLTVLSFDLDYDEPLILMLRDKYNIDDAPAVVVNNIPRHGLTSKEEIYSILKGTYKSSK